MLGALGSASHQPTLGVLGAPNPTPPVATGLWAVLAAEAAEEGAILVPLVRELSFLLNSRRPDPPVPELRPGNARSTTTPVEGAALLASAGEGVEALVRCGQAMQRIVDAACARLVELSLRFQPLADRHVRQRAASACSGGFPQVVFELPQRERSGRGGYDAGAVPSGHMR